MQAQVLLGREVAVERRVLEDQADVAPDLVAFAHHVVTGHLGRAATWSHERAEHVDGRRLASPVGTQEAEDLTGANLEIDAPHRLDLIVALDQAVDRHGGCGTRYRGARLAPPSSSDRKSTRLNF